MVKQLSRFTCRDCGERIDKCICDTEVTQEMRTAHFNATGTYASATVIADWADGFKVTAADMPSHKQMNVGASDYAQHKIQPWDIWREYELNPWDADIIKRVLRTKEGDSRKLDYQKIIHICQERIAQLDGEYESS